MIILPDQLDDEVLKPLKRVIAELREPFSLQDLAGYIERWRCKDLRIEYDKMPAGITGYAIGLRDCDFIGIRAGLSPTQELAAILHEKAHFIRGDIELLSNGAKTSTYAKFIRKRDRHALATSRQRFFDTYDTPKERHTETLARIFLQYIQWQNQLGGKVMSDIYGV